ncbi:MAG TPA: hypothetical protein VMU22_08090 [Rhizomicrobium sp.]|nr:hypothetical protein [Rhizomicrobium sp.]
MKRWSIAGITMAAVAVHGGASGQRMLTPTIPLNEIMPRLPPVPEPEQQPLPLCGFSQTTIPLGDVTPATRAEQTPDGIALYGGEGPTDTTAPNAPEDPSCTVPPG